MQFDTAISINNFAEKIKSSGMEVINATPLYEGDTTKFSQTIKLFNDVGKQIIFSINLHESSNQKNIFFFVDIIKNEFLHDMNLKDIKREISLDIKNSVKNKIFFIVKRATFLDLEEADGKHLVFESSVFNDCVFDETSVNLYCIKIKKTYSSRALIEFFLNLPFYSHKKTIIETEKYQAFYFKQPIGLDFNTNLKGMMELKAFLNRKNIPVELEALMG